MAFEYPPQKVNVNIGSRTITQAVISMTLSFPIPVSHMPNGNWATGEIYFTSTTDRYGTTLGHFVFNNDGLLRDMVGGSTYTLSITYAPNPHDEYPETINDIQIELTGYLPAEAQGDVHIVHTQPSSNYSGYSPPVPQPGDGTLVRGPLTAAITLRTAPAYVPPTTIGLKWGVYGTTVSIVSGHGATISFTQGPLLSSINYSIVTAQAPTPTADETYTITVQGPGGDIITSTYFNTYVALSAAAHVTPTQVDGSGNQIAPPLLTWSTAGSDDGHNPDFSTSGPGLGYNVAHVTVENAKGGSPKVNAADNNKRGLLADGRYLPSKVVLATDWQYQYPMPASGSTDVSVYSYSNITYSDLLYTVSVSVKLYRVPAYFQSSFLWFQPFNLYAYASDTLPVPYPSDTGKVAALATTTGQVSGGVIILPGGGGTGLVPRRSCLSAPTSRYCRAEDIKGAGIGFWRAGYPVPKLMLGASGAATLWEVAGVPVTSLATDTSPSLAADIRGQLYCAFARQGAGAFVRRSDDMGSTWGTETLMILGGQLPAIAAANGAMLAAAIVGTAQSGYSLMTAYKAAGDRVFSAPVVAVYAPLPLTQPPHYAPLVPQLSGIALCQAAEGPGRWVLSMLVKGEAATSEWWSSDSGQSWTRIPTA